MMRFCTKHPSIHPTKNGPHEGLREVRILTIEMAELYVGIKNDRHEEDILVDLRLSFLECCYSDFSVTQVSLFRPSLSLFVLSISRLFISYSRLFYSTYIRPYILLVCHNPLLIPLAPIPSPTPFRSESYFYLLMFYFMSVSFTCK